MDFQRVPRLLSASLSLGFPSQACLWTHLLSQLMTDTIPDPGRMQFDY